ncbi:hypothetical protein DIPPA_24798 [Diplonema papillatum]|nr:hypothetical protein DIPPA_24798 [Diplonema papillatum]
MPKVKKEGVSDSSPESSEGESSDSALPEKSRQRYTLVWRDFIDYIQVHCKYPKPLSGKPSKKQPTEAQYATFFKHLVDDRSFKPSTMWSIYSMLNAKHTSEFGVTLKDKYPKLAARLKVKSRNYTTKKAKAFTIDEVMTYVSSPSTGVHETQLRALVSLSYFGGLRCAELRQIDIESIVVM